MGRKTDVPIVCNTNERNFSQITYKKLRNGNIKGEN